MIWMPVIIAALGFFVFIHKINSIRNKSVEEYKERREYDRECNNPGKKRCGECSQKSVHYNQMRCTNINCRGKMIYIEEDK